LGIVWTLSTKIRHRILVFAFRETPLWN